MTQLERDRELAAAAAAGDEAAWREIYTATRERLFGFLCYRLGNRSEALDVLQETWIAAVGAITRYEARSSLECWLTGIALRKASSWRRRFLPRIRRTVSLDDGVTPDIAAGSGDPDAVRLLEGALARIPEKQATAVLLHEWLGYPFADVALVMGIGEATARVHAFRGRDALRALLSDEAPENRVAPVAEETR